MPLSHLDYTYFIAIPIRKFKKTHSDFLHISYSYSHSSIRSTPVIFHSTTLLSLEEPLKEGVWGCRWAAGLRGKVRACNTHKSSHPDPASRFTAPCSRWFSASNGCHNAKGSIAPALSSGFPPASSLQFQLKSDGQHGGAHGWNR